MRWAIELVGGDRFSGPSFDGGIASFSPPAPPRLPPQKGFSIKMGAEADAPVTVRMVVGFANVCSLRPGELQALKSGEVVETGRMQELQSVFEQEGLVFAGIVESRCRQQKVRMMKSYFALCGGADPSGSLGCELWVKRGPSLVVDGHPVSLRPSQFITLHASPRLLVVSLLAKTLALDLVVFHAPTGRKGQAKVREWWRWLAQTLEGCLAPDRQRVFLCDTNSRVGSAPSEAVGRHWPQTQDQQGEHFHRLLDQWGMLVPQTFPECIEDGGQGRAYLDLGADGPAPH